MRRGAGASDGRNRGNITLLFALLMSALFFIGLLILLLSVAGSVRATGQPQGVNIVGETAAALELNGDPFTTPFRAV